MHFQLGILVVVSAETWTALPMPTLFFFSIEFGTDHHVDKFLETYSLELCHFSCGSTIWSSEMEFSNGNLWQMFAKRSLTKQVKTYFCSVSRRYSGSVDLLAIGTGAFVWYPHRRTRPREPGIKWRRIAIHSDVFEGWRELCYDLGMMSLCSHTFLGWLVAEQPYCGFSVESLSFACSVCTCLFAAQGSFPSVYNLLHTNFCFKVCHWDQIGTGTRARGEMPSGPFYSLCVRRTRARNFLSVRSIVTWKSYLSFIWMFCSCNKNVEVTRVEHKERVILCWSRHPEVWWKKCSVIVNTRCIYRYKRLPRHIERRWQCRSEWHCSVWSGRKAIDARHGLRTPTTDICKAAVLQQKVIVLITFAQWRITKSHIPQS